MESFNAIIKKELTFRERLPLPVFLQTTLDSVKQWSNEYLLGARTFVSKTTITVSEWTKGYHWAKSKAVISKPMLFDDYDRYFCPANGEISFSQEDLKNTQTMNWNTFKRFRDRAFKIWIIDLPKDKTNWADGRCTCPNFFKKFMCKHILALALRLKLAQPPVEAKSVPIGEKRRRGRPKKAAKALLVD